MNLVVGMYGRLRAQNRELQSHAQVEPGKLRAAWCSNGTGNCQVQLTLQVLCKIRLLKDGGILQLVAFTCACGCVWPREDDKTIFGCRLAVVTKE